MSRVNQDNEVISSLTDLEPISSQPCFDRSNKGGMSNGQPSGIHKGAVNQRRETQYKRTLPLSESQADISKLMSPFLLPLPLELNQPTRTQILCRNFRNLLAWPTFLRIFIRPHSRGCPKFDSLIFKCVP